MHTQGIETVRRDGCPAVSKMMHKVAAPAVYWQLRGATGHSVALWHQGLTIPGHNLQPSCAVSAEGAELFDRTFLLFASTW